jgi:quinol monooxygenase YgiN
MSGEPIRVIALVQARLGQADAVRTILVGLIAPTRREAGCIRYELIQSATDPGAMVFEEEWRSEAELDAHLATPHVAAAASAVLPLLEAPFDIRRYRLVA